MRRLASLVCLFALAGCGGGGMSVLPRTAPETPVPAPAPALETRVIVPQSIQFDIPRPPAGKKPPVKRTG
ncbi:MAG TPA: hypothetical protein VHS78_03270 [Candidatus Elarobacter sp.]|jgi:predicted small lipoprotein YifL|nr:hypothetical protein [Candidatus Elarobacter sp.]